MAIPTYDRFIEPLLRYLNNYPEGVLARDAHDAMATMLGLKEADLAQLLPSGTQAVYKNRVGWAPDRLKRAGYSSSPQRGLWQLTDSGRAFVANQPNQLNQAQITELARGNIDTRLRENNSKTIISDDSLDLTIPNAEAITSPGERLETALTEIHESVAAELLENIGQASPHFFEILVLDLLNAMGYGTSRRDIQHVGGSGDSGIDGIISLDRLGLENVYVQAKRWSNVVGRPEVQGFYGALAGQRANKGVFITTSRFTSKATEFAQSVEGLILGDGSRLATLMIEYGIDISYRVLRVPKIDIDYFDE